MANNQITPFQLTDQFTMDNFNQRINETNTALQNNDPRQWGLGKDGIPVVNKATLDGLFTPGWYMFYDVTNTLDNGIRVGLVEVKGRNTGITAICVQEIWTDDFASAGGLPCKAERKWNGSAWSPLEWFNPPMVPGAEYRTTERWRGYPVYTMKASIGPNTDGSAVYVGDGINGIIRACVERADRVPYPVYFGNTISENSCFYDFSWGTNPDTGRESGIVYCHAGSAVSGVHKNNYATLFYVKL